MAGDPVTAIWRERPFRTFWTADAISQVGDRVSELALPLIAIQTLHASALQVSTLTALIWTPNLLAVLVGAWVDQQRAKRRLMVLADLVRALALLTLPLAALAGAVTLGQLYAVAILTGAAAVLFNVAYPAFFVHLVAPQRYVAANSALGSTRSASFLIGPSLGGVLIQLLTAPVAVAADAISFLASAGLVGRLHTDEPPVGTDQGSVLRRARDGLSRTRRDPVLRASLGCSTTINFFTFMAGALLILFAGRELDLPAALIGLALGLGAGGGLLGAGLAPLVSRQIGLGRSIGVGAVLFPAPLALVATASGPLAVRFALLAGAEFVSGAGVMLFDVNLNSLKSAVIPAHLRSRIGGAYSAVNYGVRPVGALAGGLSATAFGLRPTLVVAAAGGVLSVLWLMRSPILGLTSIEDAIQSNSLVTHVE